MSINQGLTHKEEIRLKYIEWQLDRIEDSLIGKYIDSLKSTSNKRKDLSRDIKDFVQSVNKLAKI